MTFVDFLQFSVNCTLTRRVLHSNGDVISSTGRPEIQGWRLNLQTAKKNLWIKCKMWDCYFRLYVCNAVTCLWIVWTCLKEYKQNMWAQVFSILSSLKSWCLVCFPVCGITEPKLPLSRSSRFHICLFITLSSVKLYGCTTDKFSFYLSPARVLSVQCFVD